MPRKLKPSPVQSLEDLDKALGVINRAKWTAAKREAYHKEHPENFAGPDGTYPIEDASDVGDAWGLAGHAADPDAVRSKIKSIAKRLGLTSGLPDTAKEDEDDRSISPDDPDSSPSPKDPMTTVERSASTAPPKPINFYVPIERWDAATREVVGTATQEIEDAYGTVIRYEASKDAFTRWAGNIREMHDKHKAVGRALEITPDDANKRIIVRATISKGAEDTWHKITEGILTGFSIGGRNGTWSEMKVGDRSVPALDRYDLAELSLVDNPGCPGSNDLVIVRSDGEMSQVLALNSEANAEAQNSEADAIERDGRRLSADTKDAVHAMRDHGHATHKQAASTCGCDECQDHLDALSQIGKAKADDGDGDNDADRVLRYMAPVYQRLQNIAARLAPNENDTHYQDLQRENQELRSQIAELKATTTTAITELKSALDASIERNAKNTEVPDFIKSAFETLKADVSATKAQIDKIAAQPAPGSPALNAGALPPGISAAEKRFATQPGASSSNNPDSTLDVLDRMQRAGALNSPEAQVAAAALAARPMRGYIG
jgi:hypothetical protein